MITGEEEQFVFYHRTADSAAELIALQRALSNRKVFVCVEEVVADEFEGVAVEFIRTGLRDGADSRASSGVCRKAAGAHIEFLQRVGEGQSIARTGGVIHMIRAIQLIFHSAGDTAGHGNKLPTDGPGAAAVLVPEETAPRQRNQVFNPAAVQRQFQNALSFDDLRNANTPGST